MATTARSSVFVDGTGSVLGKVKTVELTDRPMTNVQENDSPSRPGNDLLILISQSIDTDNEYNFYNDASRLFSAFKMFFPMSYGEVKSISKFYVQVHLVVIFCVQKQPPQMTAVLVFSP
jgi:hypothetical protein